MANKANLRLWVAALRSGAYTQGTGAMKMDAKHCCMGVMQEVALRAGFQPKNEIQWGVTSQVESSIFREFYGLEPMFTDGTTVYLKTKAVLDPSLTSASVLNDRYKWTFDQIADAVERTYDLLTYDEIFDPSFVPANETVAT